jgi:hypothetical protein
MFYRNVEQFKQTSGYVIDGVWYPRVTSIVSIKAKPALYRFYAELESFRQGESIKQQSADEGTRVHQAVQAILVGAEPTVEPDIRPAIEAFKKFLAEQTIEIDPASVEKRVLNFNERYAGTVDSLALIDGKFGVLDIKTSQAIYRDYNLQTAAYFPPLEEQYPNLQTRWILRIDQAERCEKCGARRRIKGGREKILRPANGAALNNHCLHQWSEVQGEVELKEFPYWQDDYQAFLAAKKLWEWEHWRWLKEIGYF